MSEPKEMEKNIALNRSACGVSKIPSEPKKDNGRGNGNGQSFHKKRESSLSKAGPDAGVQRKSNPQRSRGFTDKRPRSSKDGSWTGRRDEVTKSQRAEFGSALSGGPKKMNLNHLINFTMAPRESSMDNRGPGGWRGRNKWAHRYPKYNKEQFLQANCQFVVKAANDYTLQCVDSDKLVEWDLIEQVRILSPEVPSCPICLYPPTAAKITRCGHIYCWTCMLHYLELGEKTWRKCPICYEAVHQKDLKSVVAKETHGYSRGDEITFRLMKREKGSVITQPHSTREYGKLFTIEDDPTVTCMVKLLLASPEQVREKIIEPERAALEAQLQERNGELEDSFTEAALRMIKEREESIYKVHKIEALASHIVGLNLKDDTERQDVDEPVPMMSPSCKNYKHYSSAFSDEELDLAEDHDPNRQSQGFTVEEPFEDIAVSPAPKQDSGKDEAINAAGEAVARHQSPGLIAEEMGVTEGGSEEDTEKVGEEHYTSASSSPEDQARATGGSANGKDHVYYFYQAEDGQHLYLHSLNVRCLIREHGSFAQCPERITAKIVEVEHMSMNEALRRRLRYLFHLPLTCDFGICELEFKPPLVSKATLQYFAGDFQQRKKARERKVRNEKKQERKMQLKENKRNGKYVPPKFSLQSSIQFPSFGVDSVPGDVSYVISETSSSVTSLDSPASSSVGSPTSLSQEETAYGSLAQASGHCGLGSDSTGGPSPVIGSWASAASAEEHTASCPSFAQMLREGKTRAETSNWPKMEKAGGARSLTDKPPGEIRKASGPGPDGSDDSSNEDYVPIPQYKDAFSDAIQAALDKAAIQAASHKTDDDVTSSPGSSKRGKKGKKKQLLFSTAGPRFK
ncbi:RING finger protein 10-like [Patiria miniata]|uniref:E3 ubiquitin-protein ligase RNF10 n=1 Tax=Patiria miniata TaxID=46514 RepID=A0A914A3N1_PATMI|nr:RING finger protein 10-like [Patiria miniata]